MLKTIPIAALCLASFSNGAAADTIYKCSEGGRPSYSDRPCGPAAVILKVQAQPATSEALQRLARERALLQEIEDARADGDKREAQQLRESERAQRAASAASAERRRCDKRRLQRKWLDEDSARAGGDEGERARLKARRQAEVLAVECPA